MAAMVMVKVEKSVHMRRARLGLGQGRTFLSPQHISQHQPKTPRRPLCLLSSCRSCTRARSASSGPASPAWTPRAKWANGRLLGLEDNLGLGGASLNRVAQVDDELGHDCRDVTHLHALALSCLVDGFELHQHEGAPCARDDADLNTREWCELYDRQRAHHDARQPRDVREGCESAAEQPSVKCIECVDC